MKHTKSNVAVENSFGSPLKSPLPTSKYLNITNTTSSTTKKAMDHAYMRFLDELEKKASTDDKIAEEKRRIIEEMDARQQQESESKKKLENRFRLNLDMQMHEKKEKQVQDKLYKRQTEEQQLELIKDPKIVNVYPMILETPKDEKRKNLLHQYHKLKQSLDNQMQMKLRAEKEYLENERQMDKDSIQRAIYRMEKEETAQKQRKLEQVKESMKEWDLELKLKEVEKKVAKDIKTVQKLGNNEEVEGMDIEQFNKIGEILPIIESDNEENLDLGSNLSMISHYFNKENPEDNKSVVTKASRHSSSLPPKISNLNEHTKFHEFIVKQQRKNYESLKKIEEYEKRSVGSGKKYYSVEKLKSLVQSNPVTIRNNVSKQEVVNLPPAIMYDPYTMDNVSIHSKAGSNVALTLDIQKSKIIKQNNKHAKSFSENSKNSRRHSIEESTFKREKGDGSFNSPTTVNRASVIVDSMAYKRVIHGMGDKLEFEKQIVLEQKRIEEAKKHQETEKVENKRKMIRIQNEMLLKQIEEKKLKKKAEQLLKVERPDIEGVDGYPRIHEMKKDEREELKKKNFTSQRVSLDNQIKEKSDKQKELKNSMNLVSIRRVHEDAQQLALDRSLQITRIQDQRNQLIDAWEDQLRLIDLQKKIEKNTNKEKVPMMKIKESIEEIKNQKSTHMASSNNDGFFMTELDGQIQPKTPALPALKRREVQVAHGSGHKIDTIRAKNDKLMKNIGLKVENFTREHSPELKDVDRSMPVISRGKLPGFQSAMHIRQMSDAQSTSQYPWEARDKSVRQIKRQAESRGALGSVRL